MKNTVLLFLIISMILWGCSADPDPSIPTLSETVPITSSPETTVGETQPVYSDYQAPLVTFSAPLFVEQYGEGSILTYTCQQMELLLEDPQVSDSVTLELVNHSDFSSSTGPRLLAEAQESGQPVALTLLHTPTRLDRGILSLVATQVVSGNELRATGAMESTTYDLISGKQLTLKDVLVPQYDAELLSNAIITALDPLAKEGQLYSDYAYVVTELFSSNTPMDRWYLSRQGLCLYFAPYEIAPYNLGFVTAEIPYDALPGLLREAYFPGEALGLTGNLLYFKNLEQITEQNQFRDLILDDVAEKWFLTAEGALEDLRIEIGTLVEDQFVSEATLFAATTLCRGDVIVLQATAETLENLYASYLSGGETVFLPLYSLIFP